MVGQTFTGVKIFSATHFRDREVLGDRVTAWLQSQPGILIVDKAVRQSSDSQYHCLSIVLFFLNPSVTR